MAAKLIRLRPGDFALTEESAAIEPASQAQGADVLRLPHYARHAKTAEAEPASVSSLPIRSAERRRWSAELAGPSWPAWCCTASAGSASRCSRRRSPSGSAGSNRSA